MDRHSRARVPARGSPSNGSRRRERCSRASSGSFPAGPRAPRVAERGSRASVPGLCFARGGGGRRRFPAGQEGPAAAGRWPLLVSPGVRGRWVSLPSPSFCGNLIVTLQP